MSRKHRRKYAHNLPCSVFGRGVGSQRSRATCGWEQAKFDWLLVKPTVLCFVIAFRRSFPSGALACVDVSVFSLLSLHTLYSLHTRSEWVVVTNELSRLYVTHCARVLFNGLLLCTAVCDATVAPRLQLHVRKPPLTAPRPLTWFCTLAVTAARNTGDREAVRHLPEPCFRMLPSQSDAVPRPRPPRVDPHAKEKAMDRQARYDLERGVLKLQQSLYPPGGRVVSAAHLMGCCRCFTVRVPGL